MPRNKKICMVGYDQDRQTVYGKNNEGRPQYADPMTLWQAKRKMKELSSPRVAKTIYKLVPVKVKP